MVSAYLSQLGSGERIAAADRNDASSKLICLQCADHLNSIEILQRYIQHDKVRCFGLESVEKICGSGEIPARETVRQQGFRDADARVGLAVRNIGARTDRPAVQSACAPSMGGLLKSGCPLPFGRIL